MARSPTRVELESTGAVGLRWAAALVCHTHTGSMEMCLLCCNRALGTLDPQEDHRNGDDLRKDIACGKALTIGLRRMKQVVVFFTLCNT